MGEAAGTRRLVGREFSPQELGWIRELAASGAELSRAQIIGQVCTLLDWRRANGRLKVREGREAL